MARVADQAGCGRSPTFNCPVHHEETSELQPIPQLQASGYCGHLLLFHRWLPVRGGVSRLSVRMLVSDSGPSTGKL